LKSATSIFDPRCLTVRARQSCEQKLASETKKTDEPFPMPTPQFPHTNTALLPVPALGGCETGGGINGQTGSSENDVVLQKPSVSPFSSASQSPPHGSGSGCGAPFKIQCTNSEMLAVEAMLTMLERESNREL
jgi:hypothetical protein